MYQFNQHQLRLDLNASTGTAEPALADLLGDSIMLQLMDSDRVSMQSLTDLLGSVRQRLAD